MKVLYRDGQTFLVFSPITKRICSYVLSTIGIIFFLSLFRQSSSAISTPALIR